MSDFRSALEKNIRPQGATELSEVVGSRQLSAGWHNRHLGFTPGSTVRGYVGADVVRAEADVTPHTIDSQRTRSNENQLRSSLSLLPNGQPWVATEMCFKGSQC